MNTDQYTSKSFTTGAALVVGGSGGIGSAICTQLASAGANVVLTYRSNLEAAQRICADIESMGVQSSAYALDLLNQNDIAKIVKEVISDYGHIHSVVYASGPPIEYQYINEISGQEWSRVIDVDVNGCFNLIEATLPHFRERSAGNYVAVTTAAVHHAPPRDILSAAPKAAIEMLINGVAREEGRNGIRANCVRPGYIKAGLGVATLHEHTEDYVSKMERAVPMKRAGEAHEVAQAAVFLLSDSASYVTGCHIPVAGGLHLV